MALTGTPLINDIDDFRAIWQFLGWIDGAKPRPELMHALDETGLTPADPGFYAAARRCVIDLGIVRRRKVDVAADIPARRIADLPVELDGSVGRSIRAAERELARRMVARYETALADARSGAVVEGIDHDLVRQVARWEQKDATTSRTGENVFSMMRRIGQAKADLAADYAMQLAHSAGKVVFFAKHVDVMDVAEATFAQNGVRFSSIRGDQTPPVRQRNIDAFVNDPDVAIAVCSLTAAGVGHQPPGGVQPRARGAVLDRAGADAGHRPQPPHRADGAGHRVAHHRRADDRRQHRRADRQQGGPRRAGARRLGRGGRRRRPTCSTRRSSRCSPTRCRRPPGRSPPPGRAQAQRPRFAASSQALASAGSRRAGSARLSTMIRTVSATSRVRRKHWSRDRHAVGASPRAVSDDPPRPGRGRRGRRRRRRPAAGPLRRRGRRGRTAGPWPTPTDRP